MPRNRHAKTGITSKVLHLNDKPLQSAAITISGKSTRIDFTGGFALTGIAQAIKNL